MCFFSTFSFAQDYYVLHLSGEIKEASSQRHLMVGDIIHSDSELIFSSANAKALVISKEKGRMLLDGTKARDNHHGEFEALLTQVIMPVASNETMSSRRLNTSIENKDIKDIGAYFGKNQRVVFGDEYILNLDKEIFKKKGGATYIYRYELEKQAVNKVLKIYDGAILLSKAALYPIDRYDVPESGSNVEIYLTNVISKKSDLLGTFKICFVNDKVLYKEIHALIKALQIVGNDEMILAESNNYISSQYGEPFEEDLKKWLIKKEFISLGTDLK